MVEYNVEISQLLTPEQLKTTGGKPDSPFASQSEGNGYYLFIYYCVGICIKR